MKDNVKFNRSDRISLLLRPVPGLLCAMSFGFGLWLAIGAQNISAAIGMATLSAMSVLTAMTMYYDYRAHMAHRDLINQLRTRALSAEMRMLAMQSQRPSAPEWPVLNMINPN